MHFARSSSFSAHLALFLSALLWGSSFLAMKVAVSALGPLPTVWMRLVVASLVFLACGRSLRGQLRDRADLKWIVLMALFEPGLYFVLEGYALRLTTSAQAGTVAAMLPLMIAAMAWLVLGERVARNVWAGFGMAIAGVVLLTLAGAPGENAPRPWLGNFLEFLAMVSATGYMITLKRLTARYSPWFLTAMQAFVGAVFFTPLAVPQLGSALAGATPAAVWACLYLGVFITVGAYALYNYGMSQLPASLAAGYVNLIPVVAVALGWLLLDEVFAPQQWLAAGLVIGGVYVSQRAGGAEG